MLEILFSLGFGSGWLQPGAGCETAFISLFKQRLTDIFKQVWSASILQKGMRAMYRDFESVFGSEKYFDFVDIKCFKDYLVKLRLGSLPLNSSTFNPLSPCDTTVCWYYCNEVENEKQLIYVCPLYDNIRARYLNGIMTGRQSGIIDYDVILFILQWTLEHLSNMRCVFGKNMSKLW